MDGGDEYAPGLPVAQQLFRTQTPVSIGFGLLVERVGFAERLAVPGIPYPVRVPDVLIGQTPWKIDISGTRFHRRNEKVRYVTYKNLDLNVPNPFRWPDGIDIDPDDPYIRTSLLPEGEKIEVKYDGINQDHVNISVSDTDSGGESAYTGDCDTPITPDEVVALLENAIQNKGPDLKLINDTITDVLHNIDDDNAPTFDGKTMRFCFTSFLTSLKNRVLRAGGRKYIIVTFHDDILDPELLDEEEEGESFGEFLANLLQVRLYQPGGADIMASFVDLCLY